MVIPAKSQTPPPTCKDMKKSWEPKFDTIPFLCENRFYSCITYSLDLDVVLSKELLDDFVVIDTRYTAPQKAPKNLPKYRMFIPKDPVKLEREGKSHVPDIYGANPKLETWDEYRGRMEKREILLKYMADCMKRA